MVAETQIARLARLQQGNVTTAQLRRAGLSYKEIETRARRGLLIRRHQGVYAVGHVPDAWLSAAFAAWLAHGPMSALSHRAGAAVLGALPEAAGPIHVTRATKGPRQPGTVLHEADLGRDVWRRRGLLVTSPPRLMLDLAATEPAAVVERAYNQAQVLKLLTPAQLHDRLETWTGQRGSLLLRTLLEDHGVSRSVLEDAFRRLVRQAGLTQPRFNEWVDGVYADAVWPEQRVVVELDGRAFHGHDRAFEEDRSKANRLQLRGWTVLRFTHRRLTRAPYAVIAELVSALERTRAA